jgi:hypothetical protein
MRIQRSQPWPLGLFAAAGLAILLSAVAGTAIYKTIYNWRGGRPQASVMAPSGEPPQPIKKSQSLRYEKNAKIKIREKCKM